MNQGIANPSLWYWRTQDGNEMDFVVEKGTALLAIEAKLKERPAPNDLRGFEQLQKYYGTDAVVQKVLFCKTKGRTLWNDDVIVDNGLQIADLIL